MAAARNKYAGLGLQQAQEKIIEETKEYQESPDDAIPTFADFIDLPPRSLKDYYATIQHPLSLKSLLKAVKGTSGARGKNTPGATTPFQTWSQFEREISYIWVNTFEYNVEESEIYARGKQLETFVKKALKEAKQAVPDSTNTPAAPSTGSRIKLFTRKAPHDSPAPEAASSSGTNEAAANSTGRSSKRLRTGTPTSAAIKPESAKTPSYTVPSPALSSAAPAKKEEAGDAAVASRPPSQTVSTPGPVGSVMLPPPTTDHIPQQIQVVAAPSSIPGSHAAAAPAPAPAPQSSDGLDYSRFRSPGQTVKDALITNVIITSHPGLNVEEPFSHNMKAWDNIRMPHFAFHLSDVYNYVQIKPILADGLINRQHKMYVMINNQILPAMPMIPGHPMDPLRPLFETRLERGTNRIDVQIRATLLRDAPRGPNGEDYEDEYWTICPHLRRIY